MVDFYCFCAKDKEVLIGDYCSSRTYCRCEDIGNGFVPCPVLEINVLIFTEGQLISSELCSVLIIVNGNDCMQYLVEPINYFFPIWIEYKV